MNVARLRNN